MVWYRTKRLAVGRQTRAECRLVATLAAAALGLVTPALARAERSYTVTDLGLPDGSCAYAINDVGQVVGYVGDRAFIWQAGGVEDLGDLGGGKSCARDINSAGQVAGDSLVPQPPPSPPWPAWPWPEVFLWRAFLWAAGDLHNLGLPPVVELPEGWNYPPDYCRRSGARGINDYGEVAGYGITRISTFPELPGIVFGIDHGVLWDAAGVHDLGAPSTRYCTWAHAINNARQVVGTGTEITGENGEVVSTPHAVLWSGGGIHQLGDLGGGKSWGMDINDAGHSVGYGTTGSGATHAVLWRGGSIRDLGDPYGGSSYGYALNEAGEVVGACSGGAFVWCDEVLYDLNLLLDGGSQGWALSAAYDINESGQIVGYGRSPEGRTCAFLATPRTIAPPEITVTRIELADSRTLVVETSQTWSVDGSQRSVAVEATVGDQSLPPLPPDESGGDTSVFSWNLEQAGVPRLRTNTTVVAEATATENELQDTDNTQARIILPVVVVPGFVTGSDLPIPVELCQPPRLLLSALKEAASGDPLLSYAVDDPWRRAIPDQIERCAPGEFYVNYQTLHANGMARGATQIGKLARYIRDATYADRFHIVAHSLGGLAARWYTVNQMGDSKSVATLVMLGTPHRGSSDALFWNWMIRRSPFPAARQFLPLYPWYRGPLGQDPPSIPPGYYGEMLVELNSHPPPSSVAYHLVAGTQVPTRQTFKGLLGNPGFWDHPSAGDGVVLEISAFGFTDVIAVTGSDAHATTQPFPNVRHETLLSTQAVLEYVFALLGMSYPEGMDTVAVATSDLGAGERAPSVVVSGLAAVSGKGGGAQITFVLTGQASVTVAICNVAGRPVKTLCGDKWCSGGSNTLIWDARSEVGTRVPAGTYLVSITARSPDGSTSRALAPLRLNH